jgi:uncharacterized membrane protein YkoI
MLLAMGLLLAPVGLYSAAAPGAAYPATAADNLRAGQDLTRTQAAALVQKRYAARVVRASSSDEGGHRVYVFRLLSDGGKVWTVRIDAHNGTELP